MNFTASASVVAMMRNRVRAVNWSRNVAKYSHPDAFLDLVGQEIVVSDWHTITQDQIDQFAAATGDHQWLHVDTDRAAKEMPDGKTIAHGFLVLSLIPGMAADLGDVDNLNNTINYGLNKVRFTAMVQVNSRFRLRQTLKSAEKRADGSVHLVFEGTMDMEGSERPAMVAETIRRLYPTPGMTA